MPSDLMPSKPETGAFPSHSVCRPQQRKRGKGENKWNVIFQASGPVSRKFWKPFGPTKPYFNPKKCSKKCGLLCAMSFTFNTFLNKSFYYLYIGACIFLVFTIYALLSIEAHYFTGYESFLLISQ